MEYISLGRDCCVAYHLQKLGVRRAAYPFDWLLQEKKGSLTEIIRNDFRDFLNPDFFKIKGKGLHTLEDEWREEREREGEGDINKDCIRVLNTKYNVSFLHDFTKDLEIERVQSKYQRRIDRFYRVMLDPKVAKRLVKIEKIQDVNEDLPQLLLSKGFVNFEILSIHSATPTSTWKREEWEWRSLLFNFSIFN